MKKFGSHYLLIHTIPKFIPLLGEELGRKGYKLMLNLLNTLMKQTTPENSIFFKKENNTLINVSLEFTLKQLLL